MFLTRKHLSRRTVLKGAGATIALPLLDAMIPAGTALAQTAAAPARASASSTSRMARLQDEWQPTHDGPRLRVSVHPQAARAAARLRDRRQRPAQQGRGKLAVPHGIIEETWLNCVSPRQRNAKTGVGVTADQIAARHLRQGHDAAVDGNLRRARRHDLVPHARRSRCRWKAIRARCSISMFGQGQTKEERQAILGTTDEPARLRDGIDGQLEPQARRRRPREGRATTWIRSARSSCACRSSRKAASRWRSCRMRRSARRTISASCSTSSSRCSRSPGRRTARTW